MSNLYIRLLKEKLKLRGYDIKSATTNGIIQELKVLKANKLEK